MINGVNSNPYSSRIGYTNDKNTRTEYTDRSGAEETGVVLDIGSGGTKSAVYGRPSGKINAEEINRLWEQTERATESLRNLVERLIGRQGKKAEDILSGKEILLVDDEARAEAEKMISEDGEWGVKAVSSRIVDFAKAISGGDKSRLGELRNAIEEGFKQAEKAFGGTLPDISRKTYDEVMKQLDEWEKEE
jgi:hypothetical protein